MKSTKYTLEEFYHDKPFKDNIIVVAECPDSAYEFKNMIFFYTGVKGFTKHNGESLPFQYNSKTFLNLSGTISKSSLGLHVDSQRFRLPTNEEIATFNKAFPNNIQPIQDELYDIY
jgi:hypothetical protein